MSTPTQTNRSSYGDKTDLAKTAPNGKGKARVAPVPPAQLSPKPPSASVGGNNAPVRTHVTTTTPSKGDGNKAEFASQEQTVAQMQKWADSYTTEQAQAEETLRLAQELFIRVVASGTDDTHPSVTRTAVSCLMLEQICAIFARYHSVLGVVSNTIMRSIYVPDVPEMRDLLGNVEAPIAVPSHSEEANVLLKPYARKPYFIAFEELSAGVAQFARNNRNIEVRLSRQTAVFDSTVKHWMSSLVRNYFSGWRQYTRRRNALRQKYRAVFSRIRTDECKIRAIRRWRDRAGKIKRMAAVDAASASELQALRLTTQKMQEQINQLGTYNQNLSSQVQELENERQTLQSQIMDKEREYSELVQRGTDMEKLGNELIDSVLMKDVPPPGADALETLVNWAHDRIEENGGMIDGSVFPFQGLLGDEFIVETQPCAMASVMQSFNSDKAPSREKVVQMHMSGAKSGQILCDMYTTLTGTTCLVNDEQLDAMQRGAQLLFLAGLMRFQSHWLQCKPQLISTGKVSTLANDWTSWPDRVKIQQQWVTASLSSLHCALEVALQHPHTLTTEEQEDLTKFLSVPATKIQDILPAAKADECYIQLFKALNRLFPEIRKVYYAYAVPSMGYHDFQRLMKDCRVVGDKRLTKKAIEHMCIGVLGLEDHNPNAIISDLGQKPVTPMNFVECLIRVALLFNRRLSHDAAMELTVPMVVGFINESIIPHALRSDVDRFKQAFRHPQVQQVISRNKIALRRAFGKYAAEDNGESMDRSAFYQMARDCLWITKTVSQDVMAEIYKRCQVSDQGSLDLMDLNEWLEAVCAVTVYHDPNPFSPLHVKLVPFIDAHILAPLGL